MTEEELVAIAYQLRDEGVAEFEKTITNSTKRSRRSTVFDSRGRQT
jgi:hypothetical protein